MKKLIVTSMLSFLCSMIQAQTFVCTNIDYRGSDLTPQKIQKEKAKYLGSKATLTFYDKTLKISVKENGKTESLVLDKVNNNEYKFEETKGKFPNSKTRKVVIKLNKLVEYIRSFTVEGYNNYSLEVKVTYKRD